MAVHLCSSTLHSPFRSFRVREVRIDRPFIEDPDLTYILQQRGRPNCQASRDCTSEQDVGGHYGKRSRDRDDYGDFSWFISDLI